MTSQTVCSLSVVYSKGSGASLLAFEPWLFYILAVWCWEIYLASLDLSFFICLMVILRVPVSIVGVLETTVLLLILLEKHKVI